MYFACLPVFRFCLIRTLHNTEGPKSMVQKAIVYGGIMYLLSGNLMEKKEPFQYTEETIDF